jgi:hypothetical protein
MRLVLTIVDIPSQYHWCDSLEWLQRILRIMEYWNTTPIEFYSQNPSIVDGW